MMKSRFLIVLMFFLLLHFFCFNIDLIDNLNKYLIITAKFIELHSVISVAIYLFIYVFFNVCCLPFTGALRIISGVLFGITGLAYALLGSTLSASISYWLAKNHSKTVYEKLSNKDILKLGLKFKKNTTKYLILLRLFPIFPAWLVSIAAGIFNLDFKKFILISTLGFIPSTLFYVILGTYNNDIGSFKALYELPPLLVTGVILISIVALSKRNWHTK
ncbi:MAG: VTT domain-containing protein [Legionellales bacterium]|jgi:uncharacterized membrane protein YdjX (TVP38/TMEM64 family)|nr:VTT domain-containing protein [Legionellales bacterium]